MYCWIIFLFFRCTWEYLEQYWLGIGAAYQYGNSFIPLDQKEERFSIREDGNIFKECEINPDTGFPSLISEVSSGIVMIVFNIILLELSGNVGVAAYGVIANLSLVVVSIYTGIAQGIQPLFSKGLWRK